MDDTSRIPDGTRVRLRGHIDPVFYGGMAKTGNEGWITKHERDENGLPVVWITWDRDHWADNQQPDSWSFEEHFEPIPEVKEIETRMSNEEEEKERLWQFFKSMTSDQSPPIAEGDFSEEELSYYNDQADKVEEFLEHGEAFLFVGVRRTEPTLDAPEGQVLVTRAHAALSPEADAIVGFQLSELAAAFHKDAALTIVHHLTTGREDL